MAESTLLYGKFATGKTQELALLAEYMYEVTGLPARMVSRALSGVQHIRGWIDAGFIDYLDATKFINPLPTFQALSLGAWFPMVDQGSRKVFSAPGENGNDLSKVSCYLIEEIDSIGAAILRAEVQQCRSIFADRDGGSRDLTTATVESMMAGGGDIKLGPTTRGHYMFAQQEMLGLIRNFSHLPVKHVIWTAHEIGEWDDKKRAWFYGPEVVGQAMTPNMPQNLGDTLHCERYEEPATDDQGNPVYLANGVQPLDAGMRAWLRPHKDPATGQTWPSTVRVNSTWRGMPDEAVKQSNLDKLWKRWPKGYIDLGDGPGMGHVADLFRFRDEELVSDTENLRRRREEMDRRRGRGPARAEALEVKPAAAEALPAGVAEDPLQWLQPEANSQEAASVEPQKVPTVRRRP